MQVCAFIDGFAPLLTVNIFSATDVGKIESIEIYPPIGIVRVGDSAFSGPEQENVGWFFAPDIPSKFDPLGQMKFKDKAGNVKRQVCIQKNKKKKKEKRKKENQSPSHSPHTLIQ
jgi:hypothetical protein